MNVDASTQAGRATALLRVLLVVALVLGLCAMHVVAAVVGRHHHAAAHGGTDPVPAAVEVMEHIGSATTSIAHAQTSLHDHHVAKGDCVLFLSAGIALLLVLVAWAAARALRCSPWLSRPWFATLEVITPWRGPPAWHWPRVSLGVIRV
ncbi:MAG: hypothetical protein ACRYF3_11880 [Janthinobacterium lividum]